MADGSCGDEVKHVGVRAFQLVEDLRGEFVADFARRINSTHEAERRIGKLANRAPRFEFAEPLERKHAVGIAFSISCRIAEMPDAQVVASRAFRNAPI